MKIAIDMQGIQSDSRFRGIGRYSLELVTAMVTQDHEHEFVLILNGAFPETLTGIQAEFQHSPKVRVLTWYPPLEITGECLQPKDWKRELAEASREFFIAELDPDLVLITSLFEGYVDSSVVTIKKHVPGLQTACIFYDLIPLLNPSIYLDPHPVFKEAYLERIEQLKRADFFFAISASAEREAAEVLGSRFPISINISAGCNEIFRPLDLDSGEVHAVQARLGIHRPFVLYTGGSDGRKNLNRLIEAYAALPGPTRSQHQLVLAGKMPEDNLSAMRILSAKLGLKPDEVVWTGYVSDEEMVRLYNACRCFILPSIHEGFGLPALEALKCGALVIGSNTSSIPEVIGYSDALFDPFDVGAITEKLYLALTDETFREKIIQGTLKQKDRFSWEQTAKRATYILETLTKTPSESILRSRSDHLFQLMDKGHQLLLKGDAARKSEAAGGLSFLLQSTPRRQMFVDISEWISSSARTGVQRVVLSYLKALANSPPEGFSIEPVFATGQHGYRYAHRKIEGELNGLFTSCASEREIFYQAGDVFLALDMQHYIQLKERSYFHRLMAARVKVIFMIYDLLPIHYPDHFPDPKLPELHAEWIRMISEMDGSISISRHVAATFTAFIRSENLTLQKNHHIGFAHLGCDISSPQTEMALSETSKSILAALDLRVSFISVGTLEPRKQHQQILDAFDLLWKQGCDVNLVLVGAAGWNVSELIHRLSQHPEKDRRLFWMKGIDDGLLTQLYEHSSCLIAASLDEGFGLPTIEASHHGVDLILRDIPVFREVAGSHALYFEGLEPEAIESVVLKWLTLKKENAQPLSRHLKSLSWTESAEALKSQITLINERKNQLLIDISALIHHDAGTGIQRVVKNLIDFFKKTPPDRFRVELVYATQTEGYRYAKAYQSRKIQPVDDTLDEPLEVRTGDLFFALDMNPDVQPLKDAYFKKLQSIGVHVSFMIYDLLCHDMPEFFEPAVVKTYHQWLRTATSANSAICISKDVADRLKRWVDETRDPVNKHLEIQWVHLGATPLCASTQGPSAGFRKPAEGRTFIMVGTIEPRKGHQQVLAAFNLLWSQSIEVNLILVGKRGWLTQALSHELETHSMLNERLFWYEQADDNLLSTIYAEADCLIAASFGEGFGLPLIEAASLGIPIIARDLAVFREVAGEHAFYFSGSLGMDLAEAIRRWLVTPQDSVALQAGKIHRESWDSCGQRLSSILLGQADDRP